MHALGGVLTGAGPPTDECEESASSDSGSSDSSNENDGPAESTRTRASVTIGETDDDTTSTIVQWDLASRLQRERLCRLREGETALLARLTAGAAGGATWPRPRSAGWLTPLQAAQVRLLTAALPYAHFQRPATPTVEPEPEPRSETDTLPELPEPNAQPRPCLLRDTDVAESIGLQLVGRPPLHFTRAHWAIDIGAAPTVHPWRNPCSSGAALASSTPPQIFAHGGSTVAALREECAEAHTGATAIVGEVMTGPGVHFAEVLLLHGSQTTFGVVHPAYDPPDADIPSEPDAQEGERGGANGDWRQAAGGAHARRSQTEEVATHRYHGPCTR